MWPGCGRLSGLWETLGARGMVHHWMALGRIATTPVTSALCPIKPIRRQAGRQQSQQWEIRTTTTCSVIFLASVSVVAPVRQFPVPTPIPDRGTVMGRSLAEALPR